jgi:hypothetical protein
MLDPYRDFVRATLEQYPRLCSTRLLEMIRDRGYLGSVFPLRRYVRHVRPVPASEAFFRLSKLPGEEAQVDWGSFGKLRIGSAERALSCFVLVLSWSRATFARFTLDQTLESFLRCHVEGFGKLGGVPRAILYDNLKSVVLERQGDLIRFHNRILELAGHYHFAPKPVGIYIYEDQCTRGRAPGEVMRLMREGFDQAERQRRIIQKSGELASIAAAISSLEPGDLILCQVDQVELALAFVNRLFQQAAQRPKAPIAQFAAAALAAFGIIG